MFGRSRIEGVIAHILSARRAIVVVFALLLPVAVGLALGIPTEAGIDRLIVPTDPDAVATRAFQEIFPESEIVVLLAEARDPWSPAALAEVEAIERAAASQPEAKVFSALALYRKANPAFSLQSPEDVEAFRRFGTTVTQLRRQALVGDTFLGVVVAFPKAGSEARNAFLAGLDRALAETPRATVTELRRVGRPYVEAWIERASNEATARSFPLFGLFVVVITLVLYRSLRALLAILLALGTAVALAVAAGAVLGYAFTLVSSLVPLTVMVTALANLVYVHSRYVDRRAGTTLEAHHVEALMNKALPITVSNIAAIMGFAALLVSEIRPVREMGVWTAVGLAITWVVTFTLFPALERVLDTPTGARTHGGSGLYDRLALQLPERTRRHRFTTVLASIGLAAAGLAALLGVPGFIAPMQVGIDPLDYIAEDAPIHRDTAFFRDHVGGLNVARLWITTPAERSVTDAEVLRAFDALATQIEGLEGVSSVVGPTTFLRMRRFFAGEGEQLPQDAEVFERLAGDIEQLILAEPELRGFIHADSLAHAQIMVTFDRRDPAGAEALARELSAAFAAVAKAQPGLSGAKMQVVGESMLEIKVGRNLVPTLTESFLLTAALIFVAFLFVFRSAEARLIAMIPSLFAILVTFLGMRLFGAELNVATILIATTVLGTTENDQIHFFHHLDEGGPELGAALAHTLRVSGRAIVFATLINCAGFLGLAFSSFPPMRQFGIITASAFLLALIADFTALPGALWLLRRRSAANAP